MRRVGVGNEGRAHASDLIRGHVCTDAAAADYDPDLRTPLAHGLADLPSIIRIIIRLRAVVRAEVFEFMSGRAQFFKHALVQRIPAMICADCDSHISPFSTPLGS